MAVAARAAIAARRFEVCRFTLVFTGVDLTDVPMAMQVRLRPNTPGSPLIALAKVTTLAAEGLKLDSVTTTVGVPRSVVKARINASTMSDATKVPYAGELGDDTVLAYALQLTLDGDARTRLFGDFVVAPNAYGSDTAPTTGYGAGGSSRGPAGGDGGTFSFGDQVVSVTIDGADALGVLVAQAGGSANAAHNSELSAAGSATSAGQGAALARGLADLSAMPRDPIAAWALDSFVAPTVTNPGYVPNLAMGVKPPTKNFVPFPRRAMANGQYWQQQNTVITDNAAPDSNDGMTASLIVGTGPWFHAPLRISGLPAQQYTMLLSARRHGSSNQTIYFSTDGGTTKSNRTLTSTLQRLTYTFTGVPNYQTGFGYSSDATVEVESFEIVAGAVDPGAQGDDGNLYFGPDATFANGQVTGPAWCSFPAVAALPKWTVVFSAEDVTAPGGYPWVFTSAADISQFNFGIANGAANPPRNPPSGVGLGYMTNRLAGQEGCDNRGGGWDFTGTGTRQFAMTYDGATVQLWVGDVRSHTKQGVTNGALAMRDLLAFVDLNFNKAVKMSGLAGIWDRCLSDAEIRHLASYQRLSRPAVPSPGLFADRWLVVDGDSKHGPFFEGSWPWKVGPLLTKKTFETVYSVNGSVLGVAVSDAAHSIAARTAIITGVVPPDPHGRKFYHSFGEGTNDLAQYPTGVAGFISDTRALLMARAAAGFDILLWTLGTRNDALGTEHDLRRAVFNADVRTNWALYGLKGANRIIDLAAHPQLGIDQSRATYPALWFDALHESNAGEDIKAALAAAVINALP